MVEIGDVAISKIKPVGPWCLIRIDNRPDKTDSGLFLPNHCNVENVQERAGVIVAMGDGISNEDIHGNMEQTYPKGLKPGLRDIPTGVAVGARVMFRGFLADAHHGSQFPLFVGEQEYCFLHMGSLLAILEPDVRIGHLHGTPTETSK